MNSVSNSSQALANTSVPPPLAASHHPRWAGPAVLAALVLLLAAFPWLAPLWGLDYYVDLVRRMLTVSIAALSLNFLIGRAGLVALGLLGAAGLALAGPLAELSASYGSRFALKGLDALHSGMVLVGTVLLGWLGAWLVTGHFLRQTRPTET